MYGILLYWIQNNKLCQYKEIEKVYNKCNMYEKKVIKFVWLNKCVYKLCRIYGIKVAFIQEVFGNVGYISKVSLFGACYSLNILTHIHTYACMDVLYVYDYLPHLCCTSLFIWNIININFKHAQDKIAK